MQVALHVTHTLARTGLLRDAVALTQHIQQRMQLFFQPFLRELGTLRMQPKATFHGRAHTITAPAHGVAAECPKLAQRALTAPARAVIVKVPASRALRVIHVLDASATNKRTGRMVMTGSMADVCAELDRLAAREATLH